MSERFDTGSSCERCGSFAAAFSAAAGAWLCAGCVESAAPESTVPAPAPAADPVKVADTFAELAALLGLDAVNVGIVSAKLVGQGGSASAQLRLTNGEELEFAALRDMARPAVLRAELVATAGATPKMSADRAVAAIACLRNVARREATFTEDEIASDWADSYLALATVIDVDMKDQASRWAAFSDLRSLDDARREGASMSAVLRDVDGTLYVRSGHFFVFVRHRAGGLSEGAIGMRMQRVGWGKRSRSGRIKATAPGFSHSLNWAFFSVPPEHDSGNEVTAGTYVMRAREDSSLSRVEVVTGRYPVTSEGASS